MFLVTVPVVHYFDNKNIIIMSTFLYCIPHHTSLFQTAHRLLELFSKLKELGHPSYSDPNYTFTLKCSITLSDANKEVIAFSVHSNANMLIISF